MTMARERTRLAPHHSVLFTFARVISSLRVFKVLSHCQ